VKIVENAKTQRYGTCNTTESLLVARAIAAAVLPDIGRMLAGKGVEMRGCAEALEILKGAGVVADKLRAAVEADWYEEYLGPIIAVKVVDDLDAAIIHINTHGSQHTDAIVTEDYGRARRFLREVDSPASWSTPRRASPTALNTASAPRSAFPPTRSTPAARSASKASPARSGWCWVTATSAADGAFREG
jgi:hypothetical protein